MAQPFGTIAPGQDDEDDLMNTYYDPGTGLPVGGTGRYEPPKKRTWMMEPDLLGTQMGSLPEGVSLDDANRPVDRETGEPIQVVRRPGVLPIARTPDGLTLVKPKLLDLYSYITGGPVEMGAAETALGAGRISRVAKGVQSKMPRPGLDDLTGANAPAAAPEAPPTPKMQVFDPNQPPPMGHNMPPEEEQLSPHEIAYPPPEPVADRSKFIDPRTGLPIKSAAYTKEAQRILSEIDAGPKGAGPIDLSKPSQLDVPQTFLPRYDPPGGVSARLQDAMNNPAVLAGMRDGILKGMQMGAHKWYDTGPVRDAFINELGPIQGDVAFKRYMDNVAATSPRSDVPTNVRNASYYFGHETPADLPEKNPYPYGHVAQNLHRQNFETISGEGGWEPLQNPKPASFSQNLQGNHEPVTVDTHAFRALGMRTNDPRFLETSVSAKYKMGTDPTKDTIVNKYGERKGDTVTFRPQQLFADGKLTMDDALKIPYFWAAKPKDNEYGAMEDLYRYFGDEHGISPAAAQAAGWAGSGELTGLGTVPDKTFPELLNERILFTAKMRGEDPQVTLKNFIRGKKPLLSVTGPGPLLSPQPQDKREP